MENKRPPKQPPEPKPLPHEVDAKALTDIITILSPLATDAQERVLRSVQAYFSTEAKKDRY